MTDSSSLLTYPTSNNIFELSVLTLLDQLYTGKEYPEEYSLHSFTGIDISGEKRSFNIFPDWNPENPCWVVPPNAFFVDGNHPKFELTCLFLNNYATLETYSYYVNKCKLWINYKKFYIKKPLWRSLPILKICQLSS